MRRRDFIVGLGSTTAWPLVARAQQPAMPVVGLLRFESLDSMRDPIAAFRRGLADSGYVEGRKVAIESRSAEGQADRLFPIITTNSICVAGEKLYDHFATPGDETDRRATKFDWDEPTGKLVDIIRSDLRSYDRSEYR
jgi:hypothetical protein